MWEIAAEDKQEVCLPGKTDDSYWHEIPVLTGAEKGLVSGLFQTFLIKESRVEGTSDVLGPGSKRGKMTQSGHLRDLLLD